MNCVVVALLHRMNLLPIWYKQECKGHFINYARYNLTDMYILVLCNILLQSFYVISLILNSQRFGRFAIQLRAPLLFSPRVERVAAAEKSSRKDNRCPRTGSFNMGNKSKSGLYLSLIHICKTGKILGGNIY